MRQRQHIDRLLDAYAVDLRAAHDAVTSAGDEAGKRDIQHSLHMIDEMLKMEDPIKLNRWFGFLQGVMWMLGLRTINEMRDETRGDVHADFTTWPNI